MVTSAPRLPPHAIKEQHCMPAASPLLTSAGQSAAGGAIGHRVYLLHGYEQLQGSLLQARFSQALGQSIVGSDVWHSTFLLHRFENSKHTAATPLHASTAQSIVAGFLKPGYEEHHGSLRQAPFSQALVGALKVVTFGTKPPCCMDSKRSMARCGELTFSQALIGALPAVLRSTIAPCWMASKRPVARCCTPFSRKHWVGALPMVTSGTKYSCCVDSQNAMARYGERPLIGALLAVLVGTMDPGCRA